MTDSTVLPITDEGLAEVKEDAAMISGVVRTIHTELGSGALYWEGETQPLGRFTDWSFARAAATVMRSAPAILARLRQSEAERDALRANLAGERRMTTRLTDERGAAEDAAQRLVDDFEWFGTNNGLTLSHPSLPERLDGGLYGTEPFGWNVHEYRSLPSGELEHALIGKGRTPAEAIRAARTVCGERAR